MNYSRILIVLCALLSAGLLFGFNLGEYYRFWTLALGMTMVTMVFGYGLDLPYWGYVAIFFLGFSLALSSEANRRGTLERYITLGKPLVAEVVIAESPNNGTYNVDFSGIDLKVKFPRDERTPQIGEIWQICGWVESKALDDCARRQMWIRGKGTYAKRIGESRLSAVYRFFESVRRDFSRRIGIGLTENAATANLHRTILLGEKQLLPKDLRNAFVDAGTVHIFAISGLHVMVVASLLIYILAITFFPVRWMGVVLIPMLWAYAFLIGHPPSAVRAVAMASIYFLAPIFWRKSDSLVAWALVFLVVHIISPANMINVGSLLSFTVMLAIILWLRLSKGLQHPVAETLGVTISAWAVGVPICAYYFGQFTLGGLLCNYIMVPAAGVTVIGSSLGVLVSYVSTALAAHINNLSALFTRMMVFISESVASIPGAAMAIKPWTKFQVFAWYALIILLAILVYSIRERRRKMI